MPDRFVPLASAFEQQRVSTFEPTFAKNDERATVARGDSEQPPSEHESGSEASVDATLGATLRELILMRVAAREAYARLAPRLLEALARDVLGRELATRPCDLERLAREGLARFEAFEPVRVRVPAGGAHARSFDVPIIEDPALGSHDFIIDVRDGIIDARFATRVGAMLEACA